MPGQWRAPAAIARSCWMRSWAMIRRIRPAAGSRLPPTAPGLTGDCRGLVIGHVTNFTELEAVSEESQAACLRALEVFADLGAEIKQLQLPSLWDYTIANTTIMTAEAYAIHAGRFANALDKVSDLTRHRIALGAFFTAEDYIKAQKAKAGPERPDLCHHGRAGGGFALLSGNAGGSAKD